MRGLTLRSTGRAGTRLQLDERRRGPPVSLIVRPRVEFGNTLKDVRQVVFAGFAIGGIAIVASVLLAMYFGNHLERPEWLIPVFLAPPLVLFIGIIPTYLFHIRTRNGNVEHVFVNRFVLSSFPIERFVTIRFTGIGPALLFEDGARIRFYGATFHNLANMAKHLTNQAVAARALRGNGYKQARP